MTMMKLVYILLSFTREQETIDRLSDCLTLQLTHYKTISER